jgi:hypothetical protein
LASGKKVVYVGLIVLGAAVWLIDRLILSSGEPAAALASGTDSPVDAPQSSGDEARPAAKETQRVAIPEIPFPRGVPNWQPDEAIRDPFDPDGSRSAPGSTHKQSTSGSQIDTAPAPNGRDQFVQEHRLTGVFAQKSLKIAVVNRRWIRVGEALDGCTLNNVNGTTAEFECADGPAVLEFSKATRTRPD